MGRDPRRFSLPMRFQVSAQTVVDTPNMDLNLTASVRLDPESPMQSSG